jgi:acyl dehydratase
VSTTHSVPVERSFEDTSVGDLIGPVVYGPMTVMHLVRWCAAMENWHRIHYDYAFCQEHEGLPGPLVNGSWKQQVLAQLVKDWAGPAGWLQALEYEFRGMDVAGATLRAQGRVTARELRADYGEVRCAIEVRNNSDEATTVGEAVVVLPRRGGPEVRYPAGSPGESDVPSAFYAEQGLCPAEYKEHVGVKSETLVSTDAIDSSSVRRFMQAIMVRDEDYFEDAGRGAARFGTIVAPPLYPLHALHVPATADDPLEQAQRDEDFDGASQTPWSAFGLPELPGAPKRILNAGNRVELYAYAPLGTHIDVTSCYDDIYQKSGRRGPLLFISVLSRYTVHETGQPLLRSWQKTILR